MRKFEAHILVVDDDDGIRNLLKKYLSEKNFLITTASSAEDAQEKLLAVKLFYVFVNLLFHVKFIHCATHHIFK